MSAITRMIVKNIVVAATLGLAAIATWAITDSHAPALDASAFVAPRG